MKPFCLDCGTHIEEVPRTLVATDEGLSPEEQVLVDSINEHDTMTQMQVEAAAQLMTAESHRLPSGDYSVVAIAKMFLDCVDRVLTTPPPTSAAAAASQAGQEIMREGQQQVKRSWEPAAVTENTAMVATKRSHWPTDDSTYEEWQD